MTGVGFPPRATTYRGHSEGHAEVGAWRGGLEPGEQAGERLLAQGELYIAARARRAPPASHAARVRCARLAGRRGELAAVLAEPALHHDHAGTQAGRFGLGGREAGDHAQGTPRV